MTRELIIDSFAGGGGASLGIEWATGRSPDIAINHDRDALIMHAKNHPQTEHVFEDVWRADLRALTQGRPVGLLWASPDCKHFSRAKGGKPVEKKIRSLAWIVTKWAQQIQPRVICLENVREFADWGPLIPRWKCRECDWRGTEGQTVLVRTRRKCPRCESHKLIVTEELIPDPKRKGLTFRRFVGRLQSLGYAVEYRNLNAADYGAPTNRRRLFLIARCDGEPITWPEATHGKSLLPYRTAAECIDWSIPCPSIFARDRPLANNTLRRIALGIQRYVIGAKQPFLVNTLDTQPRFALVATFLAKHFGGAVGAPVTQPLPTTTVRGTQTQLVAVNLVRMNHGEKQWNSVTEPAVTITSGNHAALVYSFLVKYYGTAIGADLSEPLPTVTSKDRCGLVTVTIHGEPYVIVDIGMRVLTPRELARAQGFPDSYQLTGTKTSQVARIGNSVCPPIARAIVAANYVVQDCGVKA